MTNYPRLPVASAWLCLAATLCGCTSVATEATSAGAGVAGAAVAHGVTHNAGVVTGIGLGVQAAANAGLQYAERKIHQTEQDRIAAVAGTLPVGTVGRWQVAHAIPLEADEQGEVTVSRVLGDDATVNYITRKRQQAEQDAIAGQVATMQVGERRLWKIQHDIPIGNEHGEVQVTRTISTPLAWCKDLVFSVESDGGKKQAWYTTQALPRGRALEVGTRRARGRTVGLTAIVP